ncbi:MBL fold metallo-hydrolase [Notoacmeibacter sp. MSK16QG-6]|uniref:MBL fold metallo-hydrolase n=1 Tax=Notoacmeibacter sp. MSK16QG-6 TaxID=2957982 RepID=UPI00209D5095|nr:MBL fold metallo-hydrolase [Notoacmeibacter sp. MSK16QG-6]MCP1199747.1 MBL fold metallo-hydrolase [Notoacmeibacter sp. MSK16QG-6]
MTVKATRRNLLLSGLGAALAGVVGWGATSRNRYYEGPVSDHFDGERFFNPGSPMTTDLGDFVRMRFKNESADWPQSFPAGPADQPPSRVEGTGLRVSFVGHATFLLQMAGLNILTDPVWSDRASPLSFTGPKRVNNPGIAFEDLPPIDLVLLSHNHYDHMDEATIMRLVEQHNPRFIVPLGNDAIVRSFAPDIDVEAFDWGDELALSSDVTLQFHQAHHWSARGVKDRRMALWAAFSLRTPAGNIYFSGDTGYAGGEHFRTARRAAGPFRLALLPIGAYDPRWFMSYSHQDPAEAVIALDDLGAEQALAYHWGTFKLTGEPVDEPPALLSKALQARGIDPQRFLAPRPGEVWEVS